MNDAGHYEIDRKALSIVLRRRIGASPERSFDAWTRVDQISRWWDPTGRPLAECDIDPRVGGTFRFANLGFEDHPFEGRYTIFDRPNRIAFQSMGALGLVTFDPDGPATRMTVSLTCATVEQLEMFVAMGIADGTARSLDNLQAMLHAA